MREWRMARTAEHEQVLRDVLSDDRPDSVAWRTRVASHAIDGGGRDSIWWAICNSTINPSLLPEANRTHVAGSADSERPLQGWAVVEETLCAPQDVLEGNYTDAASAEQACGKNCSAVQDVGCNGTTFRLCRIGAAQKASKMGTCLHMRSRRGPQNEKFWREFCARKVVPFRLLFAGRRCAQGKVLDGALTEVACAEVASSDPACSGFFDVRLAAPPPAARAAECRCLPKNMQCEAASDPTRDVYALG